MKKLFTLLLCLVCVGGVASASSVLQKSDKMQPRWVKHTPKGEHPDIAYRVVQVYVDNLNEVPEKAVMELANYLPREWGVRYGSAKEFQATGTNESQLMVEVSSYGGKAEQVPMRCLMVDSYWEYVQMGYKNQYRCYVLYQVKRPNASPNVVEHVRITDRYGFAPVAISIIPGAGQMYKGSYLKGGLIMGSSVLCAGGIVLCEATKGSYQALANKEHNAAKKKTYQNNANNWGTGSYVCIGALAALWIYNLIDAGVTPGAKHMVIDKGNSTYHTFQLMPTMIDPYTPALTARFTF